MRRTGFVTGIVAIVAIAASGALPAFARDDGPRFAQDRLDALVAQHAQANRYIASAGQTPQATRHAAASKEQRADGAF
jgi:hypothetical protein